MTTQIQSAFRLAPNLSAKADPALIGADERWFAAIDAELAVSLGAASKAANEEEQV